MDERQPTETDTTERAGHSTDSLVEPSSLLDADVPPISSYAQLPSPTGFDGTSSPPPDGPENQISQHEQPLDASVFSAGLSPLADTAAQWASASPSQLGQDVLEPLDVGGDQAAWGAVRGESGGKGSDGVERKVVGDDVGNVTSGEFGNEVRKDDDGGRLVEVEGSDEHQVEAAEAKSNEHAAEFSILPPPGSGEETATLNADAPLIADQTGPDSVERTQTAAGVDTDEEQKGDGVPAELSGSNEHIAESSFLSPPTTAGCGAEAGGEEGLAGSNAQADVAVDDESDSNNADAGFAFLPPPSAPVRETGFGTADADFDAPFSEEATVSQATIKRAEVPPPLLPPPANEASSGGFVPFLPPPSAPVRETGFGTADADFDAPFFEDDTMSQATTKTAEAPPPLLPPPANEAPRGGFMPFLPPPPPAGTGLPDDDDDFSDFGDFSATSAAPPTVPAAVIEEADDDFGDFDDFATATVAGPVEASKIPSEAPRNGFGDSEDFAQPAATAEKEEPAGDPQEEGRIRDLLNALAVATGIAPTMMEDINGKLAKIFPAAPPSSTPPLPVNTFFDTVQSQDNRSKIVEPNAAFQIDAWYSLWQKMSSDTVYSDAAGTQFRWRKSHIRRAYLLGLDINIRADQTQQQQPLVPLQRQPLDSQMSFGQLSPSTPRLPGDPSTPFLFTTEKGKTPRDARDMELLEAKRLCEVAEDDLRNQSVEQLAALVASLTAAHQKMQDQANYWLDSKEQLVMDAEMHNKMIASLVQYAQQQQTAPKASPRSSSPGKKGRR
ncbi:hypothetical protein DFJ77DRAFT_511761 [Powellomyces hirtus]|nr:hypothetical protein DFJ77DRAFT_511761 [Powellomyces hirtus]